MASLDDASDTSLLLVAEVEGACTQLNAICCAINFASVGETDDEADGNVTAAEGSPSRSKMWVVLDGGGGGGGGAAGIADERQERRGRKIAEVAMAVWLRKDGCRLKRMLSGTVQASTTRRIATYFWVGGGGLLDFRFLLLQFSLISGVKKL